MHVHTTHQVYALAESSGRWRLTFALGRLENIFSYISYAGHPRFYGFRAPGSLQFSLEQSWVQSIPMVHTDMTLTHCPQTVGRWGNKKATPPPHPLPTPPHSKLGCFLPVAHATAYHCLMGEGREKLHFFFILRQQNFKNALYSKVFWLTL